MYRLRRSVLVNRDVLLALIVQLLSYAAVLAIIEHGEVTPLIAVVRQLPTIGLVLLGLWAIPALVITIAIGGALGYVLGVQLSQFEPVLLTRGDALFFVVAYLLSVGFVHLVRIVRR